MNLEQLQQEEQSLIELLSENRRKQRIINERNFVEKHGFDIGDTIKWVDGTTVRKGLIFMIEFSGVYPQYYMVRLFNSNGKVGKREARIWHSQMNSIRLIEKG